MDNRLVVRELTLLAIVILGWVMGYLEHKSPAENASIRLPGVIRIFFGMIGDKELSIRGVLIQLSMYTLFLYVTLYNLEKISSNQMVRSIGWTNIVLLILASFRYLRKR